MKKEHAVSLFAGSFVLSISVVMLWMGIGAYRQTRLLLAEYRVDGLVLMFLIAWGLATLATPFFAASLTQGPEDRPASMLQAFQLFIAVTCITFVALCVAFLILWILGWVIELLRAGRMLLQRDVPG